jgi:valyl-tRNA synthetase
MRTKKLTCPKCKKAFRPGGPWPADDPELLTAKQGSDRFEIGRNFANKMWNATRFILMNLDGYTPGPISRDAESSERSAAIEELPIEDRWILSRLATTTKAITEALEGFHFNKVSAALYDFIWSEFCDWYIEMSKGRLASKRRQSPESSLATPAANAAGSPDSVQRVLVGVLDGILRLVQPVMPFVAESLWQALNEARGPECDWSESSLTPHPSPLTPPPSVVIAPWPEYPAEWIDAGVEARFARMQELVRGVREVRNRYQVDDKTRLDVSVKASEAIAKDFTELAAFIGPLAGIANFTAGPTVPKPKQSGSVVRPEFEAFVSLVGIVDPAAEAKRLEKQLGEKTKQLEGVKAKLANPNFTKAPAEVVQAQRDLAADLEKQIRAMEENLKDLIG